MLSKLLMVVVSIGLFASCGRFENERSNPITEYEFNLYRKNLPKIIAHRGYSNVAPENTIPAFNAAILAGSDAVELDYSETLDQVPVVLHDTYLDRTTDATGKLGRSKVQVTDVTYDDIKDLDAGSWMGESFRGTKLPKLQDAISFITDTKESIALVETKNGRAETFIEIYKNVKNKNKIMLQSFNWTLLKQVNNLDSSVHLAALGQGEISEKLLNDLIEIGVKTISWDHKSLNTESIDLAHRNNLKVFAYTVNNYEVALNLHRANIDGIITDMPREIINHLISAQR